MLNEKVVAQLEQHNKQKFSAEQLAILEQEGGICIIACAGSGKTTTLTNLIAYRLATGIIKSPGRMLVATYNVSGKDALYASLTEKARAVGVGGTLNVKTFHAVYLKILKDYGLIGTIATAAQRADCLVRALNTVSYDSGATYEVIDNMLTCQINQMLTDEVTATLYGVPNGVTCETFVAVKAAYKEFKHIANIYDFDDLQVGVYALLLGNEAVRKAVQSTYTYFYIDEFQDISKIQYEILKLMAPNAANMVIIGDDDQCIYEWRGAKSEILLNICSEYALKLMPLNTNYRCPWGILQYAKRGIEKNKTRYEKGIISSNDGGKVTYVQTSTNIYEASLKTFAYIKNLIASGTQPSSIAVLVRNNRQGALLHDFLLRNSIYVSASADLQLRTTQTFKDVVFIKQLCEGKALYTDITQKLHKVMDVTKAVSAAISNAMNRSNCTFVQVFKAYVEQTYRITLRDDITVPNRKTVDKALCGVTKWRAGGRDDAIAMYNAITSLDKETMFDSMCGDYVRRNRYGIAPDRVRVIDAIVQYMRLICKAKGWDALTDAIKITNSFAELDLATIAPTDTMTLTTMHGAKGREWDHVILFCDDTVSMPSKMILDTYAKNGVSGAEMDAYIDQERRLHYVAMTRAKKQLTIVACQSQLTPFIRECYEEGDVVTVGDGFGNTKDVDCDIAIRMFSNELAKMAIAKLGKWSAETPLTLAESAANEARNKIACMSSIAPSVVLSAVPSDVSSVVSSAVTESNVGGYTVSVFSQATSPSTTSPSATSPSATSPSPASPSPASPGVSANDSVAAAWEEITNIGMGAEEQSSAYDANIATQDAELDADIQDDFDRVLGVFAELSDVEKPPRLVNL